LRFTEVFFFPRCSEKVNRGRRTQKRTIQCLLHIDCNAGWRIARSTSGILFFWGAVAAATWFRRLAETNFRSAKANRF
jgi:hypothetical protein